MMNEGPQPAQGSSLPGDRPEQNPLSGLGDFASRLKWPQGKSTAGDITKLPELLSGSTLDLSMGRTADGERSLVRAVRHAVSQPESHPERFHPLVGETLLQASQYFVDRMIPRDALSSPLIALTLLESARKIQAQGQWKDPSLDIRMNLAQHRIEHCSSATRTRGILNEVELLRKAIHAGSENPVVVGHLGASALGCGRFLLNQGGPVVLAMMLYKKASELCARNLGSDHTITNAVRNEYARLQLARAMELETAPDRTGELILMAGSLGQAVRQYERNRNPEETLLCSMNFLLGAAYLTPEIRDLTEAECAIGRLDSILRKSVAPDISAIKNLLALTEKINQIKIHTPSREDAPLLDDRERSRKTLTALVESLVRGIQYAERSPQTRQDPEFLATLYHDYTVAATRLGVFAEILPAIERFHQLSLSPFSGLRLNMLYLEHTACLYLGFHERAHRAASTILQIGQELDPGRIDLADFVQVRLRLLGKATEPELGWGLTLARQIAPLLNDLSADQQRSSSLLFAQLNALAGRAEEAQAWLAIFDRIIQIDRQSSFTTYLQALGEQFEQDSDRFNPAPEDTPPQQFFDLEEIVTRCSIELLRVAPDQELLFKFIELVGQMEKSGALSTVTDLRLLASLPMIEGRFWLLQRNTERARGCLSTALTTLEADLPILYYHQAAIMLSLGQSYAMDGDYDRSNQLLVAAQERFEKSPSPTIERAATYRYLTLNHKELGNSDDHLLYFQEYSTTVAQLAKMERLPAPDSVTG